MKVRSLAIGTVLLLALPVFAHHSFAMFDMEKETLYKGTVVSYEWENPHSHIILRVAPGAKDPATVGTWDVECQSVNIMGRQGWSKSTFKPGDVVTLIAHPMKDGSKGASIFFALDKDGKRIYGDIARPTTEQEAVITKKLAD